MDGDTGGSGDRWGGDGDDGVDRRGFLKGTVGSTLAVAGLPALTREAAAQRTVVVEQGDERYEVTPLSNGERIEDFYSYRRFGHPHSHTTTDIERSDVSELFLWEGPEGLSLVVLHDDRYDSGGGQVTFEFAGLPDDGGWAVRDDNPGNDTYYGRSRVFWQWGSSHTDGAAYRDVSGAEVTVTPDFDFGIDSWQLLSGDAADPERIELDMSQEVTIRAGEGSLADLVDAKETKIEQIRNLAGTTLGQDEADREVDQRAEALLSEIEDEIGSGDADVDQLREALERMNATEAVTKTSTRTVVGDRSPTETNLENLWSLTIGLATKKIGGRVGGITGEVVNKIIEEFLGILGGLIDSFLGEGQVAGGVLDDVTGAIGDLQDSHADVFEDWLDRDRASDVAGAAADGYDEDVADAASGLIDRLDDNRTLLELVEELYFRGYYFEPDWPAVEVPTPEEIDLPELEYRWDVPDEELPRYLQFLYPDELDVIEYEFDPGEFELPATDFLDDLSTALAEVTDFTTVAGIDTTVDDRMAEIDARLGDLDEQDDETRVALRDALTLGIGGVGGFAREFIFRIEQFDDLFGDASSLARKIAIASFVVAALVTLLSSGLLGALAVGALVSVIAGLLAVMTVLGGVQLILNAVQVAVGQGFLSFNTTAHHAGTFGVAETDLGGVDL